MKTKQKNKKISPQIFLDKVLPQRRAINHARDIIKGWEKKYISAFCRFSVGDFIPLPDHAKPPFKKFLIDTIEVRISEDTTYKSADGEIQYNIQFVYHGEFLGTDIQPLKGTLKIDPPVKNGTKKETAQTTSETREGDA